MAILLSLATGCGPVPPPALPGTRSSDASPGAPSDSGTGSLLDRLQRSADPIATLRNMYGLVLIRVNGAEVEHLPAGARVVSINVTRDPLQSDRTVVDLTTTAEQP
jgi:hypothetical protein